MKRIAWMVVPAVTATADSWAAPLHPGAFTSSDGGRLNRDVGVDTTVVNDNVNGAPALSDCSRRESSFRS